MRTPLLTSWKEIAAYFGKSIRTVQRWEREHGLPVLRPNREEKHLVLASEEDLREWMNRRGEDGGESETARMRRRIEELEVEIRRLCSELELSRSGAVAQVRVSLQEEGARKQVA